MANQTSILNAPYSVNWAVYVQEKHWPGDMYLLGRQEEACQGMDCSKEHTAG